MMIYIDYDKLNDKLDYLSPEELQRFNYRRLYREVLNDLHKYFYYNQYNEDKPYYRAADMLIIDIGDRCCEEIVVFYDDWNLI